jgi:hypothetical protein
MRGVPGIPDVTHLRAGFPTASTVYSVIWNPPSAVGGSQATIAAPLAAVAATPVGGVAGLAAGVYGVGVIVPEDGVDGADVPAEFVAVTATL